MDSRFETTIHFAEDDNVWDVQISDGHQFLAVEFSTEDEARSWAAAARKLFEGI